MNFQINNKMYTCAVRLQNSLILNISGRKQLMSFQISFKYLFKDFVIFILTIWEKKIFSAFSLIILVDKQKNHKVSVKYQNMILDTTVCGMYLLFNVK